MRALAHLAKYNGCYEEWQKIIKQHGLKWKQADDGFNLFEKENITEMLDYVRKVIEVLPANCGNTFVIATLIGLRADEVCQSIRLLKQGVKDYYNTEYGVLEHFRYKDIFIRRSKKAFISLVDDNIMNLAKSSCDSWNVISLRLKWLKTPMRMSYCRKIFRTWLRQHGVETEFVDLLQGREPTTVIAGHYFRPDFAKEQERVRELVKLLHKEIQ
jgi:intergrase/recombinase